MKKLPKRLVALMEQSRTLYMLLHLEPNGLRFTLIGQIILPFFIGIQFIILPQVRFTGPFYATLTEYMSPDNIGWSWVVFGIWMFYIMQFIGRPILGYLLVWSASFYIFWAAIFGFISWETNSVGIGAVLFAAQSWAIVSVAQTLIYRQSHVNGPRSADFNG